MAPATGSGPAERGQNPSQVASELAGKFFDAVARRQLLGAGIGPTRIDRWIRARRLFPHYPGVYSWGRPDLPEKGQLSAGLLFAGKGSALDGLSALWWQELLPHRPELIHIAAPGYVASVRDLRIRHPRAIDRHMHEGIAVVDLARAMLVASEVLRHDALRNVLARADHDRLLHLPSLQAACAKGLKGSKALRLAMDSHLPQLAMCVNDFERDFVLLCESHRLPIPDPNEPVRRFRPDMLWRDVRLIVELDGEDAHSSPAQLIHDADRQRWLEEQGYTVIRFTWEQVQFRPGWVAAQVRGALAALA